MPSPKSEKNRGNPDQGALPSGFPETNRVLLNNTICHLCPDSGIREGSVSQGVNRPQEHLFLSLPLVGKKREREDVASQIMPQCLFLDTDSSDE